MFIKNVVFTLKYICSIICFIFLKFIRLNGFYSVDINNAQIVADACFGHNAATRGKIKVCVIF